MKSIEDIVDASLSEAETNRDALVAALREREDEIADNLRVLGSQLGTFPELVAKALMDVGLGTPPTPEAQAYINKGFADRMAWLQEQYRQQNGQ